MSDTTNNTQGNTNDSSITDRLRKNNIIVAIITAGITAIISTSLGYSLGSSETNANIKIIDNNFNNLSNNINEKFSSLSEDFSEMSEEIENIKDAMYGNKNTKGFDDRIEALETKLNMQPISASDNIVGFLDNATKNNSNVLVSTSAIPSDTYIGTDKDGQTYTASDIINEPVLLTYTEDNKEVYFLGQFDENYHWDGYCVTNTYNSDGTLFGICESTFDGGNRLDYISFYTDDKNEHEWIYTDRECKEDGNYGISMTYLLTYNNTKNFTNTNVRVSDIIYIDNFITEQYPTVFEYYCGRTSNGTYNDDSDNAYYFQFDDEGYVNTFYIGSFRKGQFNSDYAREIVYDATEESNEYWYYESAFVNGVRQPNPTIRKKIEQIEIDSILSELDLSQELRKNLKWR